MSRAHTQDYFERARAIAASVLFAAGSAAVIGSVLDWVTVAAVPPDVPADQVHRLPPFSGLEVGDGRFVIGAAVLLLASAFLLVLRKKSLYGWTAFLASIMIGGIGMSNYRGVQELHLDMEGIGRDPDPGVGLTLVAAAGLVGLIASAAAIAASPNQDD